MARPKRNAAIKAQASVSQISKRKDDNDYDNDYDDDAPSGEGKGDSEIEEMSLADQPTESEPDLEGESEESESALEEEEEEEGAPPMKAKMGRPRKGTVLPKNKYPTGLKYIPLTVYTPLGTGPLTFSGWRKAIEEARPVKRFKPKTKKAKLRIPRPPTEFIQLKAIPELAEAPLQVRLVQANDQIDCRKTNLASSLANQLKCTLSIKKEPSLNFELGLYSKFHYDKEKIAVLRGGYGPISALDWCKCCGKFLISSSYPSPDFKDYFAEKQSFENRLLVWKFDPTSFTINLWLSIKHNFGVARQIEWFPFHLAEPQRTFAVCLGDGSLRFVTLPNTLKEGEGSECDFDQLASSRIGDAEGHYTSFAWSLSPESPQIFLSGSQNGEVAFWNLDEAEWAPSFMIAHGPSPITSLAWCFNDTSLLAVGNHGQSVFVFDLQKPFEPLRIFTSLCKDHPPPHLLRAALSFVGSFPLVRWTGNGLVFADSESLLRLAKLTPAQDPMKATQFNITPFDGIITDYATSLLHSIAMVACANGKLLIQAMIPTHDFVVYTNGVRSHC
jgi:WD40 repeat protein